MKQKTLLFTILFSVLVTSMHAQEKYYISKQLDVSYEVALEKLKDALKDQGFGVVTEIAMHETIMSKVPGTQMDPYIMIGACNAKIAHRLLQKEANMGLLLPCKVIVKYVSENRSEVAISDPLVTMSVPGNKEILPILEEVTGQLKKVLELL